MSQSSHDLEGRSPDAGRSDGRHARSQSSRAKIVAALLELVANGDVNPSAARVAEAAGLGLRSVFRHFADMDTLYAEMSAVVEARVLPIIQRPPIGRSWKERIADIADRRAKVFETILPYRITASLKRFQSPYLMQDYRRMLHLEVALVEAQLPTTVLRDLSKSRAINVALSFQTWRLLRLDYGISAEDARLVVKQMLDDCLAGLPAA